MRICSLLPSATEIVYALGLGDNLVAVTHECDYPEEAKSKPKLTASALSDPSASSEAIDSRVRRSLSTGEGIYSLDQEVLGQADPDVIFTQELCQVCAVSYGDVYRIASKLPRKPKVISLDTFNLEDILASIKKVGEYCKAEKSAQDLVASLRERIERVRKLALNGPRPKVFFMEWTDPIMCSGHWVPELIEMAGGADDLGKKGKDSVRIDWDDVKRYSPDYIVVAPCGFGIERAEKETRQLGESLAGWKDQKAVRDGNVFASDGSAYFSRPGPRIVDGLEILCLIFHPELQGEYRYGRNDFRRVSF